MKKYVSVLISIGKVLLISLLFFNFFSLYVLALIALVHKPIIDEVSTWYIVYFILGGLLYLMIFFATVFLVNDVNARWETRFRRLFSVACGLLGIVGLVFGEKLALPSFYDDWNSVSTQFSYIVRICSAAYLVSAFLQWSKDEEARILSLCYPIFVAVFFSVWVIGSHTDLELEFGGFYFLPIIGVVLSASGIVSALQDRKRRRLGEQAAESNLESE